MAEIPCIELDSSYEDTDEPPAKRPLLDSVGACFQQNRIEREKRIAREESKREAEKVHAKFLKDNLACPIESARADYVVQTWAKIHGVKPEPKRKRNLSKLNNQTLTLSSSSPRRDPLTNLSTTRSQASRSPQNFVSNPKLGKKSRTPSPAEILNISKLTIGNQNSTDLRTICETGSSPLVDCDTYGLFSSNRNQSSSGSDRDKDGQSSSSYSNNSRENQSDSVDSDNQPSNHSLTVGENQSGSVHSIRNRSNQSSFRSLKNKENQSASNSINQSPSSHDESEENPTNEDPDRSLIIVSGDNTPTASPRQRLYTCSVFHCQSVFTSREKLNHHMNQFRHSPCNPCLGAKDGKLLPDPVCYMCPQCDQDFKAVIDCREHMRGENHLPYLPPLKVAGYMCPQCLAIFESFETCWNHMTELSHRFVSYPFADDLKGSQPAAVGPVAIPEELAMDFIDKCKRIPFRVQCLECSLEIETALMLRQHMAETNRTHPVSSLCESNPVDVFADYLAEYQCSRCCRLFTKYVPTHYCARGVEGTLIENNVKSFHDFVKSCALTLTPVDPESSSSTDCTISAPGPSFNFEDMLRRVRHSPEKGAIPKTTQKVTGLNAIIDNIPDQSKQTEKQKIGNSKEEPIILDTPPGPALLRSSQGNMVTIPVEEQKDSVVVEKLSYGKNLRFKIDAEGNRSPVSESGKETRHFTEMPSTSGVFTCETKFQNMVNVITATCSDSLSDMNKGYIPEDLEPAPSYRKHVEFEGIKGQRSRSSSGNTNERTEQQRERSRSPAQPHPTSTENLVKMKNIIFLDLDNWPGFFSKLPRRLPDYTFVWGFYGGKVTWKEPIRCYAFSAMKDRNQFYLHDRCGHTKDAADFAIVLTVGQMHERLPKHIPFTIVSGDKGFVEVERQMKETNRRAVVVDPHKAQQFSEDMIYTMVTSVFDT